MTSKTMNCWKQFTKQKHHYNHIPEEFWKHIFPPRNGQRCFCFYFKINWFLLPTVLKGKITAMAVLRATSPEKTWQEHIVYLHFGSAYNLVDLTDLKFCEEWAIFFKMLSLRAGKGRYYTWIKTRVLLILFSCYACAMLNVYAICNAFTRLSCRELLQDLAK